MVAWDGKPLTGLPAGAIRARIQRPPEGLGTILHASRVRDKVGPARGGDPLTPYDRKVAALTRSGLLGRIMPKDVATIELREEGRGVYAATFDQTSTPGAYVFNAVFDWDDPRTGRTHREERLEEFVKSKADPAKSEMTTGRPDARTVTVSVTPRDRYGNFLGPRAAVTATLRSAGNLAGPVDRDQTGTYVFTVTDVPASAAPALRSSVRSWGTPGGSDETNSAGIGRIRPA